MNDESEKTVDKGPDEDNLVGVRPDPIFKLIFRQTATAIGLQLLDTEFQYSTQADTVAIVPPGVKLENTLFDFFWRDNVVEFKSEGDRFNLREYSRSEMRTALRFLQTNEPSYANILTVIVTARYPRAFMKIANQRGIIFRAEKERSWLWRAGVGFQDVVIVVCRDLPLEPRYYPWLLFVPVGSQAWKAFVRQLLLENNEPFLKLVRNLKPKEVQSLIDETIREMAERGIATGILPANFMDELTQPDLQSEEDKKVNLTTTYLEDIAEFEPDALPKVLSVLRPEERLAGMSPDERLAGMSPDERLAGMSPDELLEGLAPEEQQKLVELLLKRQQAKP